MEGGTITEGDSGNYGGGIYAAQDSRTTLTGTYISYNHTGGHGGGIYIHAGSVLNGQGLILDHNSADGSGGAFNVFDGEVHLIHSVLSNNTALWNGGAFLNGFGDITIEASSIISNTTSDSGGGIYNAGPLTVVGVTLSNNSAQTGGGIYNLDLPVSLIYAENSTISGNRSTVNGGGIYDAGTSSFYNSTITDNTAAASVIHPGGRGGGVYAVTGSYPLIVNTILSGNHHRQATDWIDDDCHGTLHSGDYNLIGTTINCTLDKPPGHDLIGVDPLLGDLADNGGPTQTHALLRHSPAIDGGNPAGCLGEEGNRLATDQRGVYRHQDGDHNGHARCDIGAYEFPGDIYVYLPMTVR